MGTGKNVMVFIEARDGCVADVSLELICAARRLAAKLGCEVEAVALGCNLKTVLESLGQYGCQRVFYTDDSRLARFTSVPYAKTVVQTIKSHQPRIVLFGATTMGRDVAPRVASALKCGLTADCTDLQIGEHQIKDVVYQDTLLQIRPAFGGNIVATIVSPESVPSMATVREGVMKMTAPEVGKTAEVVMTPCLVADDDFLTEVLDVVREEKKVNLKAAQIIVSAGMGASDPDALDKVKELARLLGGEVGCSRPVVDAGVLDKDHQVGQTGMTVRPNLYIACGVSGQIQHRAGMSEAKRIIAINSDPQAPIFSIAHYAIVGDVKDVLTRMVKAYKTNV
ncbi:MAG: electron transfer flavoprotein subunit alpha/FixB family protein [Deltaproteobacteria bacterium]|nr:electron transfer flavoprotein subunit alpha/FixB family protein [Candidatus Anaeroferrophillus wilburensis]MBN2889112.1 electron transfer flavoprotein subunit alpha/FixB family protein [Deltaproteobacteria bacterium]